MKRRHIGHVLMWVSLSAAIAGGFLLWLILAQPNRPRVYAINAPANLDWLSFVAEERGRIINMNWYMRDEIGRSLEMPPGSCTWSLNWGEPLAWHACVRWNDSGERFGIVTHSVDDGCRVTWFKPESVPLKQDTWPFGERYVKFDFRLGTVMALGPEEVRDLGMRDL